MTRPRPVGQPLYARVLCLRHLAPSGLLCFVFLEGAVVLGILLALAELVSWWGVLVLPFTVALMVKFNDLVAGASVPPLVAEESAAVRAPVLRPASAAVRAETAARAETADPVPAPAVLPGFADLVDSVVPAAPRGNTYTFSRPTRFGPVVAAVPAGEPERSGGIEVTDLSVRQTEEFSRPASFAPVVSRDPAAVGYGPARSPEFLVDGHQRDGLTEVPTVGYPGTPTATLSEYGHPYSTRHPYENRGRVGDPAPAFGGSADGADAHPAVSNAQTRRPWTEQLDVRQQMTRQAAARRYE